MSELDATGPAGAARAAGTSTSPEQPVWNEEVIERARAQAARRFAVLAGDRGGDDGRGRDGGGAPVLVSGVLTGLVAVGVVFLAMVYSYGYLWISTAVWPPEGSASRPLLPAEAMVLLAGVALVSFRGRAVEGVRRSPAVAAGLGAVVVVGHALASNRHHFELTTTAYGAIVGTLTWTVGLFSAAALALTVGVWWQERQGALSDRQQRALATVVTQCWWFVLGAWSVTWALLFIGARSA